jgi:hypothetical protein
MLLTYFLNDFEMAPVAPFIIIIIIIIIIITQHGYIWCSHKLTVTIYVFWVVNF